MTAPQLVPECSTPSPAQLRDVLRGLPAGERHAVSLARTPRLTYREVAVVLGISEEAAKQQVRSGLKRLHAELVRAGVAAS